MENPTHHSTDTTPGSLKQQRPLSSNLQNDIVEGSRASSSNVYGHTDASGPALVVQGNVQNLYTSDFSSEERCLQAFRTSDYEAHKFFVPDKAPETCNWFLNHRQFLHWKESGGNDLLWISAGPGYGKSVLAKSLVDSGLSIHHEATTCYFFFRNDNKEQDNLATALCAILHQAFVSKPHLLRYATPHWRASGRKLQQQIRSMWRILQMAVADPCMGPVICILDAVDECREEDRQLLIKLIGGLYSSRATSDGSLKFFLTSRPCDAMELQFERYVAALSSVRLRAEECSDEILLEIHQVIQREVSRLATTYQLSPEHRDTLLNRLVNMEQRTYLWWHLALDEIYKTYRESPSPDQVVLPALPTSVEHAYERILSTIDANVKLIARTIFTLMIGAQRPFAIDEMVLVLEHLASSGSHKISTFEISGEQLRRRTHYWCSQIICIHNGHLYFIHGTVRDFLIASQEPLGKIQHGMSKWVHFISLTFSHKTLALLCQHFRHKEDSKLASLRVVHKQAKGSDKSDGRLSLRSYAEASGNFHVAQAIRFMNIYRSTFFMHRLFSFGMNLQSLDENGRSLVHHTTDLSVTTGDVTLIRSILSHGGLVETVDRRNTDCLQYALLRADVPVIELLIQAGFPVNATVATPGIASPHPETATKVNIYNKNVVVKDVTALYAAVAYGNETVISTLIRHGANGYVKDSHGLTVLHIAVRFSACLDPWSETWRVWGP